MPLVVALIAAGLGLSVAATPAAAATQPAAGVGISSCRTQISDLLPLDSGSSGSTDDHSGDTGGKALNSDDDDDDVLDGADGKEDLKGKRRPDGKAIAADTIRLSVTHVVWLHLHPRPVSASHTVHEHTAARGPPAARQHTLQPTPVTLEVPHLKSIEHARAGCSPTVLALPASPRHPISATSRPKFDHDHPGPQDKTGNAVFTGRYVASVTFKLETRTTVPLGASEHAARRCRYDHPEVCGAVSVRHAETYPQGVERC